MEVASNSYSKHQEKWYAVRTRSNHEWVARDRLFKKGIQTYLPLVHMPAKTKTGNRVHIERPLFSGYFFARTQLSLSERIEILKAPGVMCLVGFKSGPVAIPDWQIDSIRGVLMQKNPYVILWRLAVGRRVRVLTGPLTGIEGVVEWCSQSQSQNLIVSFDIFGRSVAVQLDGCDVSPITNEHV